MSNTNNVKVKSTPIQVNLITSVKGINAAIASIRTSGKAFEQLVHSTAVSILVHVSKHGNVNQAIALCEALPSLTRKNALIAWFCEFGMFKYNETTKQLVYSKKDTDVESAIKTPFWQFKAEPEFVAMTNEQLVKAITKLIERAEKSMETNKDSNFIATVTKLKQAA